MSILSLVVLVAAAAPQPPSVEATRAEFEFVCEWQRVENLYFDRLGPERLANRLAEPGIDAWTRARIHNRLGWDMIRLGRLEEAIEQLEAGLALVPEVVEQERAALGAELLEHLAMAHLQLGEDENCVAGHAPRSCILPFAPEAIHGRPRHARTSGDLYLERLAADPGDLEARWLLVLARMVAGDYPEGVPERFRLPAGALVPDGELAAWTNLAPALGMHAADLSGGAVMDDFDGDGLLDLVSSSWDPCEPMKAFRNDGRGGLEEVTGAWGLDGQLGGLNLLHADYDGDGRLDLLVLRGAWLGAQGTLRNSLLRNELDGPRRRFVDVTAAAGLAYPAYPTQTAAWADYDADGDLDLYVGNESMQGAPDRDALLVTGGPPTPSQLFRNNGDGTFTDVARPAGVANDRFAKGVAWGDYDDDGDPDLYVSAFGDNRLYRNDGDGTFTDVAPELGVTGPWGSFATWFFDHDNDGDLDLFVADYSSKPRDIFAAYLGVPGEGRHAVLYRNEGGRFVDATAEVGLDRPQLTMGANYGDLDNDGFPDVYLGTGAPEFHAVMPNLMYRNRAGRGFEDVTFAGGFGHLQKGHGIAFGDLDNDGDQDLFAQMGGAFPVDAFTNALYENPGSGLSWIVLRLEGKRANRNALGARIEVRVREGERERSIHALAGSGGSFGGSSLQQEIGLGAADSIEWISIRWPGGGAEQRYENVEPRRFYRAVEGEPGLAPLDLPRLTLAAGSGGRAHE